MKASTVALAILYAGMPLYGTLVALDPARPPIPAVVPHAVAAAFGIVTLAALAFVVPAIVRAARRDALTAAFLAPGLATIAAALPGFDPPLGIGLGVLVLGLGGAGLAMVRDADRDAVRLCIRAFLWSALLGCGAALAMWAARRPAALFAYDNGRAVGTFLNPNELAAYALVALSLAVALAYGTRGRDRLATLAAAVVAVTLLATFSRWGIFCAVLGVAAFALLARARLLLGVAVAVAVLGIGVNVWAGAQHHNPRDTEARAVAWQTGLSTFARFPLLGVGPLAFSRTYDALRPPAAPGKQTAVAFDPHSLPIAFAAEGGIVAVVTLVASFVVILGATLRGARSARGIEQMLGFALVAGLLALMTDSTINTLNLVFPLGFQVVPLALGVLRTDALS